MPGERSLGRRHRFCISLDFGQIDFFTSSRRKAIAGFPHLCQHDGEHARLVPRLSWVRRLLDGQVAQINESHLTPLTICAPSTVEVQQIRCLIPRQKRLLLAPIDNWPAWQQDGHGRSALRPRTRSGFVLMLQSAIFRAGHSHCWMQPDCRATKGKFPFPHRSSLPVLAQVAFLAVELHKVSHPKLPNRPCSGEFPASSASG